jgi:hypothetical protein
MHRSTLTALSILALLPPLALADDGTGNETCEVEEIPECSYDLDEVLLPDLMTVVPKHLQIQNSQQQELLRFSNGLANIGDGPWWLEPDFPDDTEASSCQDAYQLIAGVDDFPSGQLQASDEEVPAPESSYAVRCKKGSFDFHETHNHWHIDNIGEFKVCTASDFDADGKRCEPASTSSGEPTVGIKFTFCLIDWYKLADNTSSSDPTRNFFSCETGFQGVSPGWVDQYHHSTYGQEVDITGLPAGDYALVSTVNVGALDGEPVFEELDTSNNTSYVRFTLDRSSKGNAKLLDEVGACEDADYLSALQDAAQGFSDRYHDGDEDFTADMVDDMCGGASTNK